MYANISAAFPDVKREMMRLERELTSFEQTVDEKDVGLLAAQEEQLSTGLEAMEKEVQRLHGLVELEGARREMWRNRVQQLAATLQSAQKDLGEASKRRQARDTNYPRYQLLGDAKTNLRLVDSYESEADSLRRSNTMVAQQVAASQASLDNLRRQREHLKSSQRKMLDIGNSLGLSSSVLRMIERTEHWNAWLTYGCMLFSLIILFSAYYYFRT